MRELLMEVDMGRMVFLVRGVRMDMMMWMGKLKRCMVMVVGEVIRYKDAMMREMLMEVDIRGIVLLVRGVHMNMWAEGGVECRMVNMMVDMISVMGKVVM